MTTTPEPKARPGRNYFGRVKVAGRWFNPAAMHGTANGYKNSGCRCYRCRVAGSAEAMEKRMARAAQRVLAHGGWYHPHAPHGTANGYSNYMCRCPACRQAMHQVYLKRKARRRANADT